MSHRPRYRYLRQRPFVRKLSSEHTHTHTHTHTLQQTDCASRTTIGGQYVKRKDKDVSGSHLQLALYSELVSTSHYTSQTLRTFSGVYTRSVDLTGSRAAEHVLLATDGVQSKPARTSSDYRRANSRPLVAQRKPRQLNISLRAIHSAHFQRFDGSLRRQKFRAHTGCVPSRNADILRSRPIPSFSILR